MLLGLVTTITFNNSPYVISIHFSSFCKWSWVSAWSFSENLILTNKNTLVYLSRQASFCPFYSWSTNPPGMWWSQSLIFSCVLTMLGTSWYSMAWRESHLKISWELWLFSLILLYCVVSSSTTSVSFLVIVVSPVYESSWVLVNQ